MSQYDDLDRLAIISPYRRTPREEAKVRTIVKNVKSLKSRIRRAQTTRAKYRPVTLAKGPSHD